MDYFNNVLTTFLNMVVALLSMGGKKSLRFHQKWNEGLTGLERPEGELLMTSFSFLGELSL